MKSDNLEIAINHLIKAIQEANDTYEFKKVNVITELNDFSDWYYLIDELEQLTDICEVNAKIHKLIEDADEILRTIKKMKEGK